MRQEEVKKEKSTLELLDNVKKLFSPEELDTLKNALDTMKALKPTTARLIRPIVPIEEWINSHYYVGATVENLYPYWKQKMIDIVNSPVRINQVILTGAIGVGKTSIATLLIIRRLYELSCYENVAALFKLFSISRIAFAYLSVTKEQAQHTGFSLLTEWIDSIPYFNEHFKRYKGLDSMLVWTEERLLVTYGSIANHFIGMNVLGAILDEANFFTGKTMEDTDYRMNTKVSELYTQIVTRSQSRFIVNGINYSLSILVSSATVISSFTNERIELAKDDPHTIVIAPSLWEVKPDNYCGEKFLVYAGGDTTDPFIVEDINGINSLLTSLSLPPIEHTTNIFEAYKELPIDLQANIIQVPIEHRQAFQGNIAVALQQIAGFSTSSSLKLFSSNAAYQSCIDSSLSHPFSKTEITLSTTKNSYQDGFLPIKSYLLNGITFQNPNMLRYMHLDLAVTGDSVGIAMSHIAGFKNIYKKDIEYERLDEQGDYEVEDQVQLPNIKVDFMLRINPPEKPNRISFSKIRDFILYLRDEKGIKFGLITADQFQSEQLLQELTDLGFPVGSLSVDRTPDAYLALTNLFYEGRIYTYDYEPFKRELFGVVYYPAKKKVDHLSTGSKDVSDAVAGSIFNAIKSKDKTDIREEQLTNLFLMANKLGDDGMSKALEVLEKALLGQSLAKYKK